jgi:hypothetical protein
MTLSHATRILIGTALLALGKVSLFAQPPRPSTLLDPALSLFWLAVGERERPQPTEILRVEGVLCGAAPAPVSPGLYLVRVCHARYSQVPVGSPAGASKHIL